jgi:DNA-binding CsgD family transcriptional regulator
VLIAWDAFTLVIFGDASEIGTLMEHLQIAFDLLVIVIGFAALSIAISWALRSGESHLLNFCLLYALFTIVLIITVLKKYLSVNVQGYSAWTWYLISGVHELFTFAVVAATIHFLLAVYQIPTRRTLALVSAITMLIADALVFSPLGAVLDAPNKIIHFGIGYRIATGWYFAAFTFAIVLGFGWLHRVWKTDKRTFVLGLLLFAAFGYVETLLSFWRDIRIPAVTIATESSFLYSSIPYALYGIFVIIYFLNYFVPASVEIDQVFESFLAKYGITEREREIILKVIQGKSNADIARELVVSIATVKTHLHNIYSKVGVNSRYNLLAKVRSGQ